MNDDDLKRLLRNALAGRQAPVEVKARVLARLWARPRRWGWAVAAAALMGIVAAAAVLRPAALPAVILTSMEQHEKSSVFEHPAAAATPREIAEVVQDAIGRKVQLPGLRDAGFSPLQAHSCAAAGGAHVIYANHWLKLSCFIFRAEGAPLFGGAPVGDKGVEGRVYARGSLSAVAIRDGAVVKVWVSDLRPAQVASIAADAERKRHLLAEAVIEVPSCCVVRPMERIIEQMPGVEGVEVGASKEKMDVRFDPRRVSPDEIIAVLRMNEIEATLQGGGEGR